MSFFVLNIYFVFIVEAFSKSVHDNINTGKNEHRFCLKTDICEMVYRDPFGKKILDFITCAQQNKFASRLHSADLTEIIKVVRERQQEVLKNEISTVDDLHNFRVKYVIDGQCRGFAETGRESTNE